MTPRILEYEDGRVKVTAEAFSIPEIKDLIDAYDMKVEPYLSYVHGMSAPDSPYINLPVEDRAESAIYDITQTLGDFDYECPLAKKAIEKLQSLYKSPMVLLAEELDEELHRMRKWLRDNPIIGGSEGNIADRRAILKEIDKYALNVASVKKQADAEINSKMKGDRELGDY